jgi:O-antigen/teichoic acid export membrane protein
VNTTVRTIVVSAATVGILGLAGTATAADLTTPAHHQAVAAVADTTVTAHPAAVVRPVSPATYTNTPQQVTAQSAPAIAVGTTGVIILGFLVWYAAKHHGQKWIWLTCSFALGVSLSTSVLGGLSTSLVNSGVTAVSNVASGIAG